MRDRRALLSRISKDRSLSEFARKVYRVLVSIPPGEVRSYAWVAGRVGAPGAARAVGNVLHRNPYAPLVPCHRVIRADGALGGYAGGAAAKRRLLRSEGVDLASSGRYNRRVGKRQVR